MNNVIEFTVKRSEWLRGETSEDSFLLRRSDNKMCCLGFCSLALGYTKEDILGYGDPSDLFIKENFPNYFPNNFFNESFKRFNSCMYPELSDDLGKIMTMNDEESISDQEREALLTELFLKLNIKIIFED